MITLTQETPPTRYIPTVFKGIGQIMLQENSYTGLLFLIGIFYDSVAMGLAALLAAIIGTLTGKLLRFPTENNNAGLYGFSPCLVGTALIFYFEATPLIWVLIILGASLTAMIQHLFIKYKVPGFTFPFILITWILLFIIHTFHLAGPSHLPVLPTESDFTVPAYGFGEVIFQGSLFAGAIFFVAVFINNPVAALYGATGAIIAAYLTNHLFIPVKLENIHIGLFSFNAVLCAIVFSGKKNTDGIFVLIAIFLSVLIDVYMVKFNLSVLTFPFVLSTWITLWIKKQSLKIFTPQTTQE